MFFNLHCFRGKASLAVMISPPRSAHRADGHSGWKVVQFSFSSADSALDIQECIWKDALRDAAPNVPAVGDVSFVGVQASPGLSGLVWNAAHSIIDKAAIC